MDKTACVGKDLRVAETVIAWFVIPVMFYKSISDIDAACSGPQGSNAKRLD